MWRKVLTPTLLVIAIWILIGSVTTFYIHWLSELHTRVLNENVGTIQAVADMQHSLLRLQALPAFDGVPADHGAIRLNHVVESDAPAPGQTRLTVIANWQAGGQFHRYQLQTIRSRP